MSQKKIYLWSSSHASKWHKLPKYLKQMTKRKIIIKAIPGRKVSMPLVHEIKEAAENKELHILMLGRYKAF